MRKAGVLRPKEDDEERSSSFETQRLQAENQKLRADINQLRKEVETMRHEMVDAQMTAAPIVTGRPTTPSIGIPDELRAFMNRVDARFSDLESRLPKERLRPPLADDQSKTDVQNTSSRAEE